MRSWAPLLVLMAALAALLACTRTATPTTPPATSTVATPTPTEAATPPPSPSGSLVVAVPAGPANLDPHRDVSEALHALGPGLAYSRLLRFKTGPNVALPSLAVECDVCADWRMVDARTYEFRLRQDVRWQQRGPVNGRPLTAEDVALSYARQMEQASPNAHLLQSIARVEAVDDHTVRVALRVLTADALVALADGHNKIVAREALEAGNLASGPVVGTGPWMVEEYRPGDATVLVPNPGYFEPGLPRLERLEFRVIRNADTRASTFAAHRADVTEVLPEQWDTISLLPDVATLKAPVGGQGIVLGMNMGREPFSDRRLRQAALLALDPWNDLDTIWKGLGYVSLGVPAHSPDWLLSRDAMRAYFADPTRARQLVDEALATTTPRFELVAANVGGPSVAYAQHLAAQFRSVNLHPTLRVLAPQEYAQQVWEDGDVQMYVGPVPPSTLATDYLGDLFHSRGRWSRIHGLSAPDVDRLVEQLAEEFDPFRRARDARALQERLLQEGFFFAPVTRVSAWAYWKEVQGFHPNPAASEGIHWAKVGRQD